MTCLISKGQPGQPGQPGFGTSCFNVWNFRPWPCRPGCLKWVLGCWISMDPRPLSPASRHISARLSALIVSGCCSQSTENVPRVILLYSTFMEHCINFSRMSNDWSLASTCEFDEMRRRRSTASYRWLPIWVFFFPVYIYIYIDCTSIARDMTIKQVHRTATAEGRGNFPERTILRKFAEAYYKSGHAPKHHGKRNSTAAAETKLTKPLPWKISEANF